MHFIQNYLSELCRIAERLDLEAMAACVGVLKNVRESRGRLFFIGSGGGAGHASHAACDFRKIGGFDAFCPLDNLSELTARINDEGWEDSLANHLRTRRLASNDCLVVFSVGGGSEEPKVSANLVQAVKAAKEASAKVIGVVGRDGGFVARHADAAVVVPIVHPQRITPHTEGMQAVIWHLWVSHPELQQYSARWESFS